MQVVGDEVLEGVLSKWRGGGRKRLLLLMLRQAAMPLLYGSGTGGRRGLWVSPFMMVVSMLLPQGSTNVPSAMRLLMMLRQAAMRCGTGGISVLFLGQIWARCWA